MKHWTACASIAALLLSGCVIHAGSSDGNDAGDALEGQPKEPATAVGDPPAASKPEAGREGDAPRAESRKASRRPGPGEGARGEAKALPEGLAPIPFGLAFPQVAGEKVRVEDARAGLVLAPDGTILVESELALASDSGGEAVVGYAWRMPRTGPDGPDPFAKDRKSVV